MMNDFTQDEQKFHEYMDDQRTVTLQLAGLRETDLNDEQRAALDAYMTAMINYYTQRWGTFGLPHGAVLREMSPEENTAYWAWEEAIKLPFQRLIERVEAAAQDYWRDYVDSAMTLTEWTGTYEEDGAIPLCYWQIAGAINPGDRLFQCNMKQDADDYLDYEIWVALRADDTLDVVQARCMRVYVNGNYYFPGQAKDPGDLADLQRCFTRRGKVA